MVNSFAFAGLEEAQRLFDEGKYSPAAIEFEKNLNASAGDAGKVHFLAGISHARAQNFSKALEHLLAAKRANFSNESLPYEIGQAYYAFQDLTNAEAAFLDSIRLGFKVGTSAYYIGFIKQVKNDWTGARDFYTRIGKLRSDPDDVKQPALFQLAEIENELVSAAKADDKYEKAQLMRKKVVPLYERARDYALNTNTHKEAVNKLKHLAIEISSAENRMRNGVPYPMKAYTLKLSNELGYDSNVSTEPDEPTTVLANKDSYYTKPGILARYQFNVARRFSFTPEVNTNTTFYFRRSTPKVYQNDNFVVAPALRNKWEHMSFGQAATLAFDAEFNLMLRDHRQAHKYPFYSRYWNYSISEKVNWLAMGSTTVKLSVKLYESFNPAKNSISPQFSLAQMIKIFDKWDLSNTFTADYLRARDDFNDEKNFKMRHGITFSKLIKNVDLTTNVSYSLKDTMKQRGTRGNEINLNPSMELAHEFSEAFSASLEYSYTRNFSRARSQYRYKKHEVKSSLDYRF